MAKLSFEKLFRIGQRVHGRGHRSRPQLSNSRAIELEVFGRQVANRKLRLGDAPNMVTRRLPHDVINLVRHDPAQRAPKSRLPYRWTQAAQGWREHLGEISTIDSNERENAPFGNCGVGETVSDIRRNAER